MSDAIHLQVYKRFFAVLFSVVPGLNLTVGLSALMLWLFADVIELDWGVGVGIAAVTFAVCFLGWIFLGLGIQKWAEQKRGMLLFGLCAPFLLVDGVALAWLFYAVVIRGREEETASLLQALSTLA